MQNRNNGLNTNPYINTQNITTPQDMAVETPSVNPYYNTQAAPQPTKTSSTLQNVASSFDTGNFLKGALIGAIGAYLLTNEDAQKKIFKTFAKGADFLGAGIEEMKERLEDAKAELEAEKEAQ